MTLGEQLKKIRTTRNLSQKDVASATGMTVSIVDSIEREDFSKMGAVFYARGFIKMYANFLGVDPKPFVDEYMQRFVEKKVSAEFSTSESFMQNTAQQEMVQHDDSSQNIQQTVLHGKSAGDTISTILKNFLAGIRIKLNGGKNSVVKITSRIGVYLKQSIRLILLIIGLCIVLIFVVSAIANWIRKGKARWLYNPDKQHRLIVSESPPQPYFD